jgi:hypothetical protein
MAMDADEARARFKKIRARFAQAPPDLKLPGAMDIRRDGRELEMFCNGGSEALLEILRAARAEDLRCESLSLEEIFVASKTLTQKAP